MKVAITGAGGQLAWELARTVPTGIEVVALTRADLDIGDEQQVRKTLADLKPSAVINAAAYTAVDRAESESELAYRVNAEGPGHLAAACAELNAYLLHISTDFVFGGDAGKPYTPASETRPLGVYGASKLVGEQAIAAVFG